MSELMRFNVYGMAGVIDRDNHVLYGVSAMQAVEALGHRLMIDQVTLSQFADLGNAARNGLKSRFTHPGLSADGLGKHLGRMRNFRVVGDKVIGDLHMSESAAKSPSGDLRDYVESLAAEDPEAFGMSVVVDGYSVWVLDDGSEVKNDGSKPEGARDKYPTLRVEAAHAVDAVDEPAANRDGMFGRTTAVMAAEVYDILDGTPDIDAQIEKFLTTGGIDQRWYALAKKYDVDEAKARVFAAHYLQRRQHKREPSPDRSPKIQLVANANPVARQNPGESDDMDEEEIKDVAPAQAAAPQTTEWMRALQAQTAKAIIQASGLPDAVQQRLQRGTYDSPAAVEAAVDDAKAELAALVEGGVVQLGNRPPHDTQVFDAMDDARENVEWFFGVTGAKAPAGNMRRFDQLYVAMTGDTEFRGVFDPTRIMFANASTVTLPNLAVDAMNKVIVEQMVRMDHWRWFERIVSVEANDGTLNDMKWITIGGLTNLPTVAEGAAYTELDVDDAKEVSEFVKRGGYVGITREVIKNSNIQQLQAIPRGLANAAIRTRSAARQIALCCSTRPVMPIC